MSTQFCCLSRKLYKIYIKICGHDAQIFNIFSRVLGYVNFRRDFDWVIGFIALLHSTRNYKLYSAIADLHTLQFTITHILGFSVFTIRILATDFNTAIILFTL
jgi:hypothetical protein